MTQIDDILPDDYRTILKSNLKRRQERDPKYSLRAFGRDIGVAHNRLSEIFNRKAGVSRQVALQIAERLGLNKTDSAYFCDLVEAEHSRDRIKRKHARERVLEFRKKNGHHAIFSDNFALISDWHHFAILECLVSLPNLDTPRKIGRRLGLTVIETEAAIQRLGRLGLIEVNGKRINVLKERNFVPEDPSKESIRDFHLGILKRQREVLYQKRQRENEFNTTLLAINRDDIPEAKLLIKNFWRDFERIMDKPKKDALYCLSINFFNIEGTK